MRYTLTWIEAHDPHNWSDKGWKEGVQAILDSLPVEEWQECHDGWIEVYCKSSFEARDIEEARKIVSEYEFDCEVFTLVDEKGRTYTEETLDV